MTYNFALLQIRSATFLSDMSNSSSGNYSEDDFREDELDYEPRETEDQSNDSVEGASDEEEADNDQIDISKLVLCEQHKQGEMMNSCPTCSTAFKLIKDKDIVEKLTLKSSGSGILARYQGRCDSIEPTLPLSSDTIQLAHSVFTKGLWKDPRLFHEIVKKFLTITPEQHELLSSDLRHEDVLNKFKREPRFRNLFKFQNELASAIKHSRISVRPLFALMQRVNTDIDKVRVLGKDSGIQYPDLAPVKKGENVPRTGRQVPDKLHYESKEHLLPLPEAELDNFVLECELSADEKSRLRTIVGKYKADVTKKYVGLFDLIADHLNTSEDLLMFFSDLLSHTDSTFRELLRDKFGSLFKRDIKLEVIGQSSSKKLGETPRGLFGGQSPYSLKLSV